MDLSKLMSVLKTTFWIKFCQNEGILWFETRKVGKNFETSVTLAAKDLPTATGPWWLHNRYVFWESNVFYMEDFSGSFLYSVCWSQTQVKKYPEAGELQALKGEYNFKTKQ